jgi:hypothetical protein
MKYIGEERRQADIEAMKRRVETQAEETWAQASAGIRALRDGANRAGTCKWCPSPAIAGCDDQCEHCFAENSLSQSGGY